MLIQKCWKIKDPGWDDTIPPDVHDEFQAFLNELPGYYENTALVAILLRGEKPAASLLTGQFGMGKV